jgi:prevent-host-death family protein
MAEMTIRDLRNHGSDVIDRVQAGESVTITRSGRPVAELRPLRPRRVDAATLLHRWRSLPTVDPERLRQDFDRAIDRSR